jgi:hypothetical protein
VELKRIISKDGVSKIGFIYRRVGFDYATNAPIKVPAKNKYTQYLDNI